MNSFPTDEAAFLGKLAAGATHEIRNVLSVIKESAGLMGDLLKMGDTESFPHEDKFRRMIANILGQVERGAALMKGLNTLAHAPDDRMRAVDVRQVLECQTTLYARFCRIKGVTLTASPSTLQAHIVTDPVRLHLAVAAVIDLLLEKAPSGSEIELAYGVGEGRLEVEFSLASIDKSSEGGDSVEVSDEQLGTAQSIAESLGGSLEIRAADGAARLAFPLNGAAESYESK